MYTLFIHGRYPWRISNVPRWLIVQAKILSSVKDEGKESWRGEELWRGDQEKHSHGLLCIFKWRALSIDKNLKLFPL